MSDHALTSPLKLKMEIPLTNEDRNFIEQSRSLVIQNLSGVDPEKRLILIVGPCSIHNVEGTKEYAQKLAELIPKVQDTLFIIMRAYPEKPRSKVGWKGLLYDPHINGTDELEEGVRITRQLFLDITKMRIPIGTEILSPYAYLYLDDLISWACIGARTTLSQVHREIGSGLPMPIAFKNDVDGMVEGAISSMIAVDTEHSFFDVSSQGQLIARKSKGNPFSHLVLRGGKGTTNYDPESIEKVLQELNKEGLLPRVVVDCCHDNCKKNVTVIPKVFRSVVQQVLTNHEHIVGIMFESYLEEGNQPIKKKQIHYNPRLSVTDPCLGWETTEQLIWEAHDLLLAQRA